MLGFTLFPPIHVFCDHFSAMNDTPPLIELRLFGVPELRLAGINVTGSRWPRLLQMLAYVALEGPVARVDVAALLWPEAANPRGLANLRQLRHLLRKEIGTEEAGLWGDAGDMLILAASVTCDARQLPATAPIGANIAALDAATRLYRGDFLADLPLPEGAFQTWADEVRRRCREHAGRLFFRLAEHALQNGDAVQALHAARRYAELRPDDEENVRTLIRKLALEDHRSAAEEVFHALEQALARDYNRLPGMETRQLAQSLGTARKQAGAELEWRQTTLLLVAQGNSQGGCGEVEEESRALVSDWFHERLQAILERFGAYVITVPGGLTIAYFGFPSSVERSLEYAYRALTEIKRDLPELSEARCVLHCGKALASGRQPDSSGRLTSLAMRLAERLPPGCVLLSDAAQSLLMLPDGRPFQTGEDLPAAFLIGNNAHRTPGGAAVPPCLGREAEIRLLHSQYQVSRKGELVAVLLTGEAGIGKTRLVQSLRATIGESRGDGTWLEARCDPLFGEKPFHPLLEMIAREYPEGGNATLRELMRQHLPEMPLQWRGARHDISAPANPEAHSILLTGLARVIQLAATQRPFVLVVEDLHWADASTLALLNHLISHPQRTPCLLLITARQRPTGLEESRSLGMVNLPPLNEATSRMLLQFHRPDFADRECREVVRLCAGNPFFLNELARAGSNGNLPDNVQEALLGQLETLGKESKRIAQIAALLGSSMQRGWLVKLTGIGSDDRINPLLRGGILVEQGDRELAFRHALIQRAIEESLPSRRKMELYAKIGTDFARYFPEEAERMPQAPAHWLTQGADWESALPWRLMAGRQALAYQAINEAVYHWQAALELLEHLPDEDKFAAWEKDIRTRLGPAVIVASGFGPQSAENYFRLMELCHRLNDPRGELEALWGAAFFEESRAGQRGVMKLLRRMRKAGAAHFEPRLRPKILEWHLHSYLVAGLFHKASALHAEDWLIASDATTEENSLVFHDPLIGIRGRLGWLNWFNGNWQAMAHHGETAIELARAKNENGSIAIAIIYYLLSLLLSGRGESARPLVEELQRLGNEKELVTYRGYAIANSGWAEALCGNTREAIVLLENGLEIMEHFLPCHRSKFTLQLAETLAREGRHSEAEQRLQQAAGQIARFGEFYLHAPYLLARARITLAAAPDARNDATALLDKAQRIALRQGAPAFALQAALEKFRLLPECAATRATLQQLVDTLPDHPLIPDLQSARKLLSQ